jgi:hypothetical protein
MSAIPESGTMKHSPQHQLRRRVLPPYAGHHSRTRLAVHNVGQ